MSVDAANGREKDVEFIYEEDGRITARDIESGVASYGETKAEAFALWGVHVGRTRCFCRLIVAVARSRSGDRVLRLSALWPHIVGTVSGTSSQIGAPSTAETISHFVGTLSPFGAYSQIVTPPRAIYGESVSGVLLATPTMTLILVVWAVVPIPVGYWWFSRVDL